MNSKLLESAPNKTYSIVFEPGEEAAAGLRQFAEIRELSAAHFTAIGAFRHATLGYFNPESCAYEEIPVEEQVEVLALTGNVAQYDEEVKVHAHAVVGCRDGSTRGGHLLEAEVHPTLEVMLVETPQYLVRRHDPRTGLALLDAVQ